MPTMHIETSKCTNTTTLKIHKGILHSIITVVFYSDGEVSSILFEGPFIRNIDMFVFSNRKALLSGKLDGWLCRTN